MFLRRNRREIDGKTYKYWTLVQSYRIEGIATTRSMERDAAAQRAR